VYLPIFKKLSNLPRNPKYYGGTMKKILLASIIILALALCSWAAVAQSVGPQGQQPAAEIDAGSPPHHHGPPPEAFAACTGKSAGAAAQFINPRGETITGVCEEESGKLVLRPDQPLGESRGKHHGPPPEAYSACEGKVAGSTAQFVSRRGETITGTCKEVDGKLVLRPERLGVGAGGSPKDPRDE
jgi:hypothetical protein